MLPVGGLDVQLQGGFVANEQAQTVLHLGQRQSRR
jgi:hypothetical protein